MTFLEAAIEVLRREGKPLAIKRLAELAVQHNLLSVVGRDPESTMQARLAEVLDKGPTHVELQRVRPDLYGLKAYPPRPYPIPRPEAEGAAEANADADADADADDADAPLAAEAAPTADGARRRRRRRGRSNIETPDAGVYEAPASAPAAAPEPAGTEPAPARMSTYSAGGNDDEDASDPEFEVEGDGASSAPLMVSTAGDEDSTRSGEEREVRSEILGGRSRDDRGRRRREGRPGRGDHKGDKPAHANPQQQQARPQQQQQQRPQHPQHAPRPQSAPITPLPTNGEPRTLTHELLDLLRGQDARPQHVRALAQEVERRKLLEGKPLPEIAREVRMALHAEATGRVGRGLRPRIRSLGGGNYAIVERKLDEDLVSAERALEVALQRQAAATAGALRRKLSRLSPFSFEQLGRCVAESFGVERSTLVRRGDGVAYFGGERMLGATRSRVLLAIRPGEAELGRRAVGELRAGLDARGFDEGMLVSLGRLSAEGREELRAGRAVTVYDGDSLPNLLVERRLGVRVSHAPVAYLDLDFFAEINET